MEPVTRHGKPHSKCGTTLKYVKNGNCVHCHKMRMRLSARGQDLTDELLDRLDASLNEFPRRPVRIERNCRLPLIVEIPDPPTTLINWRWVAA